MANVVNHCLVWLSEVVKTHEGKAETTSDVVDGNLCRGFSSLQINCSPSVMGRLTEIPEVVASMFSLQADVPSIL